MSFPFLFLALALGAGIVFFSFLAIPLSVQILFILIFLFCGWLFFKHGKYRISFIAILLTTFFLGNALSTLNHKEFSKNTLHNMSFSTYTDFIGTVTKSPALGLGSDHLYLKTEEVKVGTEMEKHKGNLRVTIPHSSEFPTRPSWVVQDRLKVSAKLVSSKEYKNFYPQSQDRHLEIQRIHNRAYAKSPMLLETLKPGKPYSPLRIFSIIRQKLQKKMSTLLFFSLVSKKVK